MVHTDRTVLKSAHAVKVPNSVTSHPVVCVAMAGKVTSVTKMWTSVREQTSVKGKMWNVSTLSETTHADVFKGLL